MLFILRYMDKTFGEYLGSSEYLGYSPRQYYNIRKRLESGISLSPEVEEFIIKKFALLVCEKLETENKESLT